MSQPHEFRAQWSRWPDKKPPRRGLYLITRIGLRINLAACRITNGAIVKCAYYNENTNTFEDEHSPRIYDDVIAWMPMPEPCNPLPADYWHPDQIAARRYMGEGDEE